MGFHLDASSVCLDFAQVECAVHDSCFVFAQAHVSKMENSKDVSKHGAVAHVTEVEKRAPVAWSALTAGIQRVDPSLNDAAPSAQLQVHNAKLWQLQVSFFDRAGLMESQGSFSRWALSETRSCG